MEDTVKKILLNHDGWLEALSKQFPLALLNEIFGVISGNDKFIDLITVNKELTGGRPLPFLLGISSDKFDRISLLLKTGVSWSGQIKIVTKQIYQDVFVAFIPLIPNPESKGRYIFIIIDPDRSFDKGSEMESMKAIPKVVTIKNRD